MSNGDIDIAKIKREEWDAFELPTQRWFQFKAVQQLSLQPAKCQKMFVQWRHVKIAAFGLGCFLVGLGALNWHHIKPLLFGLM